MYRNTVWLLLLVASWHVMSERQGVAAGPCDYEKAFGREDKTLFGVHCGVCHSMGGDWKKVGPPLNGLFVRNQRVTGQPVSEENVRKIIAEGGSRLMPGFQYTLKAGQIGDLVRYLKEADCPGNSTAK